MLLAATYKDAAQDAKAIKQYQAVIKADSKNNLAYYNLGNLYRDQQNHQEAIKAYKKALEIKPDYISAMYNLAISTQTIEDYEGAVRAYQNFIEKAKGKRRWAKQVEEARTIVKSIQDWLDAQEG
jgi:tetratricopeptide (TPR) repeat protein